MALKMHLNCWDVMNNKDFKVGDLITPYYSLHSCGIIIAMYFDNDLDRLAQVLWFDSLTIDIYRSASLQFMEGK